MKEAILPLHKKVYEQLRKHITEGIYNEGDLLPSENELCSIHIATRPTIRKALDRLANEGFIIKQQGKGSIVKAAPKGIGILSISGTTSAIGSENLETRIIVKPEIRNWNKAFSFEISTLEKEMGCIYIERLRLVNKTSALRSRPRPSSWLPSPTPWASASSPAWPGRAPTSPADPARPRT